MRNSKVILSKKTYSDWKEIQNEFEEYMSSIDFKSEGDLIEYLIMDYNAEPELIKAQITKMKTSELEKIELTI